MLAGHGENGNGRVRSRVVGYVEDMLVYLVAKSRSKIRSGFSIILCRVEQRHDDRHFMWRDQYSYCSFIMATFGIASKVVDW
jgi:hypothetical protein